MFFNNKLIANLTINAFNKDTLFVKSNGNWNYFHFPPTETDTTSNRHALHVFNNQLAIVEAGDVYVFDTTLKNANKIYSFNSQGGISPNDAFIDQNNSNIVWIADQQHGLIKNSNIWSCVSIQPNGPNTPNVINMSVAGSNLWVARVTNK